MVCRPLRGLQSGATAAEAKEIQNAHKLSTLQLTDESQKQRQRREARWFGARWATKLMSSLVSQSASQGRPCRYVCLAVGLGCGRAGR